MNVPGGPVSSRQGVRNLVAHRIPHTETFVGAESVSGVTGKTPLFVFLSRVPIEAGQNPFLDLSQARAGYRRFPLRAFRRKSLD